MQEPHKEGVANHLDPKSGADGREAVGEASAGAHAGQPLGRKGIATRVNQGRRTIVSIIPTSFAKKRFSSASTACSAQISLPVEPTFLTSTVSHFRGHTRRGIACLFRLSIRMPVPLNCRIGAGRSQKLEGLANQSSNSSYLTTHRMDLNSQSVASRGGRECSECITGYSSRLKGIAPSTHPSIT
jgi:hypothetical protein